MRACTTSPDVAVTRVRTNACELAADAGGLTSTNSRPGRTSVSTTPAASVRSTLVLPNRTSQSAAGKPTEVTTVMRTPAANEPVRRVPPSTTLRPWPSSVPPAPPPSGDAPCRASGGMAGSEPSPNDGQRANASANDAIAPSSNKIGNRTMALDLMGGPAAKDVDRGPTAGTRPPTGSDLHDVCAGSTRDVPEPPSHTGRQPSGSRRAVP